MPLPGQLYDNDDDYPKAYDIMGLEGITPQGISQSRLLNRLKLLKDNAL